jgi:hypothetical protein
MPTLQSILLRFVARNVQSIVDFMTALDTKLDAFLVAHDNEVAALEDKIEAVFDDANKRVSEIEAEIESKVKSAAIVAGLKAGLPTAK